MKKIQLIRSAWGFKLIAETVNERLFTYSACCYWKLRKIIHRLSTPFLSVKLNVFWLISFIYQVTVLSCSPVLIKKIFHEHLNILISCPNYRGNAKTYTHLIKEKTPRISIYTFSFFWTHTYMGKVNEL